MDIYKTLLHVSGISIVEIIFYFYYIGPLETEIFTKEFSNLIKSIDKDFQKNNYFIMFQTIYGENYQYNESLKEEFIDKQNQSLDNMKDGVDNSIKESENYNNNLLKKTIVYWIVFNFLILLIYLLEININYLTKKKNNSPATDLNTTIRRELSNNNLELIRLNKNRSSSIDEEDLTFINTINQSNNNNNGNIVNNQNNTNNVINNEENTENNLKKNKINIFLQYLTLAGSIIIFQYLFINYIVLKYHILSLGEIKYMLYSELFPIINKILFPEQN
tara:strand:- start:136 stop:963 length:828 start_codon:yes stop_codon:yes gene_type:complete